MIFIIDDDIAVRASLRLLLEKEGFTTLGLDSPAGALQALERETASLIILDLNFTLDTSGTEGLQLLEQIRRRHPAIPVILITGWASIELAVKGMKLGASDFLHKPWNNDYLLQSVRTLLELQEKPGEKKQEKISRKKLDNLYNFQSIVGDDPKILEILETTGRVAGTDASVLIMGESGTGKELIAEAIHRNSPRQHKPFIKVNLGGIATSLFESEMFGHVRGAFTDARFDRVGRLEMAAKGTVFLDEIGDLDISSQVKLLRVLQDRTYEVLGSSRTKTVDVRVICATNKPLTEMVRQGTFREDLLYRINLITIRLPALRERPKDIPLLTEHFIRNLKEIYNRPGLSVTPEVMKWLQQLPLPGNIRQLKNLVERTVLVSTKDLLKPEDFMAQEDQEYKRSPGVPEMGTLTLEEAEIRMIRSALERHNGRITRAAKSLGITRSSLYRKMEKYNIPYNETPD